MSIGCERCGKDHDEGFSVPSEEIWCRECVEITGINSTDVSESDLIALLTDCRGELLALAAKMIMSTAAPSTYLEDHQHTPKRVPVRWWREICGKLFKAEDERRLWAIEIRRISDKLGS